jgi:hypothetical protein
MTKNYLCPACKAHLMAGGHIIFVARTSTGDRGLLLLSPELGDYTVTHHPSLRYREGDQLDFFCPVCQHSLSMPGKADNLAEVIMQEKDGAEYLIVFSKTAGQKCTYKVKGSDLIEAFGEDAGNYTNFWGVHPKY